jgi:xanthine dehydrogenase accessory factor
MLLVVAASSGSSPGRAGYKMAVAANGELSGSIGGGIMEVNLVEQSRAILTDPIAAHHLSPILIEQEHRKNSEHPSGMICSGRQTVIRKIIGPDELERVEVVITALKQGNEPSLIISESEFGTFPAEAPPQNFPLPNFERAGDTFRYIDKLGPKNELYIIGGGHCSLALSELISRLDFKITVFDDRPLLSTIVKNAFAHRVTIVDRYDLIGDQIVGGDNVYVVVMTLGYKTDEIVIRALLDKAFKFFGVLGSKAKMKTLLTALAKEGVSPEKLDRIHTPVGLRINSHTPEEIAVSIAAEIISVKNA